MEDVWMDAEHTIGSAVRVTCNRHSQYVEPCSRDPQQGSRNIYYLFTATAATIPISNFDLQPQLKPETFQPTAK